MTEFIEVKTACCGLVHLRAAFPCEPFSACCPNRNDDVFWDAYHPTEAAAHIIVDNMYHARCIKLLFSNEFEGPFCYLSLAIYTSIC